MKTEKNEFVAGSTLSIQLRGGRNRSGFVFGILLLGVLIETCTGMEIAWTRMTGQWPIESSPVVTDFDNNGSPEVLAVNRGGQILLWDSQGDPLARDEARTVGQLPEGLWSSSPTILPSQPSLRLCACSTEGKVVGLDSDFEPIWEYTLPGKTTFGRARPVLWESGSEVGICFGDHSGTVTCLNPSGEEIWSTDLGDAPCLAPLGVLPREGENDALLVPAGSDLCLLSAGGQERWRRNLGGSIRSRPEVVSTSKGALILCGAGSGSLFGLTADGEILWEAPIGDEMDSSIAVLPRENDSPLILCTGLWGNLHAIDTEGKHVWTHYYRSKGRGKPLVADADGDGKAEIYVCTYKQHLLVFDENGSLKDDVGLSGNLHESPVLLPVSSGRPSNIIVATGSLLLYGLSPTAPESPYRNVSQPGEVKVSLIVRDDTHSTPVVLVENPNGGLLNLDITMCGPSEGIHGIGSLSVRTAFEVGLPDFVREGSWTVDWNVKSAGGNTLLEGKGELPGVAAGSTVDSGTELLSTWSTSAYGLFDRERLVPSREETSGKAEPGVRIENLYAGEADQGAFVLASRSSEAMPIRVVVRTPVDSNGGAFGGSIVLRQVVPTGTVNGELAYDALPALNDAGVFDLPTQGAAKIWVSVDARGAEPGDYTGSISVTPRWGSDTKWEMPLEIEVLDLQLPDRFPLTLCTWDYVPNQWFSHLRTKEVLDDMSRHGGSVFPRPGAAPKAKVDTAGKVTVDWTDLEVELDRLQGRGTLLFHFHHPPIAFEREVPAEEKRGIEIEYLHRLRDTLKQRGWGYEDYAFYPVDEPGYSYGDRIPGLLDAIELYHEADPNFVVYTNPVSKISWKDFERIEPSIGIWAPNMRLVSGLLSNDPRMREIVDSGARLWAYECIAQVKSLSPLRYNRAYAWRAKYFGLTGMGFWTHCTTSLDPWLQGKGDNDEFALVYPGEIPVPSVRWEAVRDGLEDVAALNLLEEAAQERARQGGSEELVTRAQKLSGVALNDMMELSDEAFVESRDFLKQGDRRIWHTWTDVETFRRFRAEIAELTLALRE